MQVNGTIKEIKETKSYGSNGFQKREVIVSTSEQYPQILAIEFVQDKTAILDNYAEGQEVKIDINLRGREWTSPQGEVKYFITLQGWRIESKEGRQGSAVDAHNAKAESQDYTGPGDQNNLEEEEDDLPF